MSRAGHDLARWGRTAAAGLGVAALFWSLPGTCAATSPIRHHLTVTLQPDRGELHVVDVLTLSEPVGKAGTIRFRLNKAFAPTSLDPSLAIRTLPDSPGADSDPAATFADRPGTAHEIVLPKGFRTVRLAYEGHLGDGGEAMVGPQGVYLDGASGWYPAFGDALVTFTIEVLAPAGWEVISQGRRTLHRREETSTLVRWESPEPQDDIYLAGGPLTESTKESGGVTAMAFLRTPDPDLAARYLDATERYVTLYSALLGPYPYPKFALVENVRETGYGMPSFTLLGGAVIRLPFILHSSYPHEILHNWWGNGVFVDASAGNWSEGLTAYLADHLLAEQRGEGAAYRRAALQKYADYVTQERDFPLTKFRARHDPATEAVGYSKALMLFHMVRRTMGDRAFIRALREFYERFRFQRATFTDLDQAFAGASGHAAGPLAPWIEKAGAPVLRVGNVEALRQGEGRYLVKAFVEQTQPGAAYRLRVPVAVTLEGREQAYQTSFRLDTKRLGLEIQVPGRPLRFDVDPEFDVFRRLDRAELPPALSELFGAPRATVVLPASAPPTLREAYGRLAEILTPSAGTREIVLDTEIERLPDDRAVWVVGWENRFRDVVSRVVSSQAVALSASSVRFASTELTRERHAVVLVSRRGSVPGSSVGWLGCDQIDALHSLARKLPHYSKYGYLGFEGMASTNVLKGEWKVTDSPLSLPVKQPEGIVVNAPPASLAGREPLTAVLDSNADGF